MMNYTTKKLIEEFYEGLEQHTYTRDEIVKKGMARAVSFFVVKTAVKESLHKLAKNIEKANTPSQTKRC